ncbi:MAG: S8 family peptidase [Lachnospiraceae bacterium]|nr:S8 family peptidase [Lachnospiraceae bacterium]
MERTLQNIVLEEKGESLEYIPINGGGGEPNYPSRESRKSHANYLRKQLENAWKSAIEETKKVAVTSIRDGVYLQIEGKEGYDLVTRSLEDSRQHVRLLNICEEKDVVKATVYVPIKKQDFFLKKINKYADTTSGSDVITTIEQIKSAMVESLWIGKKDSIPGENSIWCEVWLRYEMNEQPQSIVDNFYSLCSDLNIEHKEKSISFPERVVVLIKANLNELEQLMLSSGKLAEIRKMVTPISFFTDLTTWEQKEWITELEKRIDISKISNTSVCILDTGVNNAHPLLKPVLKDSDMHSVDVAKGVDDRRGHGTEMAGIATYFDLQEKLESMSVVEIYHFLESVKILNNPNDNDEDLYGAITQQAAYIVETENPNTNRTLCMAITTPESGDLGNGVPTSWSASIDALLAGVDDEIADNRRRLMCISAGNTQVTEIAEANDYLSAILTHTVENPGQAWNAITVGAYTDKTIVAKKEYDGFAPVSNKGGVSPFTSSSVMWEKSKWPVKPEVVFEGGNLGHNPDESFLNGYSELEDLDVITTCKDFMIGKSLVATNMTSPATAQAAWMLANIQHTCPDLWPETVRGLLIHSATWTDEMIDTFVPNKHATKNDYRNLIRVCGYGVPNLDRAVYSAQNSVNLIIEDEIQPFVKKSGRITSNEMHMHDIPWPTDILKGLGEIIVKMRVTLSYYIEPSPGQIGWKDKYRYPSCGLIFDVNNPTESKDDFKKRISKVMRDENDRKSIPSNDSSRWLLGAQNRNVGSIHSDIWEGTAADLCQSNYIMVYPTTGWWKLRTNQKKYNKKVKYSLIVSLETPENSVNLYNEITTIIKNRAVIKTEIKAVTGRKNTINV